jgi:Protein of unknown function (DUF2842)
MMEPSWRKPFGIFAILALITAWSVMVLFAAPAIEKTPAAAQAVIYLALGIGWIAPLKPLLRWMETGRFR